MDELTLRPMTDAEYDAFYSKLIKEYATDNIEAGNWTVENAVELSRNATEQLLPLGRDTPRVLLLSAENSDGEYVGYVWVGLDRGGVSSAGAWIYDIEINESHRGKGYGRALLQAAEKETLKNGVNKLGLNVFGSNKVARKLYESAGYDTTQLQMSKNLQ